MLFVSIKNAEKKPKINKLQMKQNIWTLLEKSQPHNAWMKYKFCHLKLSEIHEDFQLIMKTFNLALVIVHITS